MIVHIDDDVKKKILAQDDDIVLNVSCADKTPFVFPLNLPLHDLDSIPWSLINDIGLAGSADKFFALGATKTDHMKNGFNAVYQIIGFNHDELADGSGKAPISWDMKALYKDEIYMTNNDKPSNWEISYVRSFLNDVFFNDMSDELRSIVKHVIKYSSNIDCKIIKTIDRVWLKSEKELYGRCFNSCEGEGMWYSFYHAEDVPYFKCNIKGEKTWQWLRSVFAFRTATFYATNANGSSINIVSSHYCSISPGFCT